MKKVLIADDHPFTLQGTKAYVEQLGYTVVDTCTNGIAAWSLIQAHYPDIAILDIDMPGLNGLEITEKVYNNPTLKTKVILLTMHKEYSIFRKASQFNIGGYLIKEKAPSELEACLREVLRGNSYLSENIRNELIIDQDFKPENELDRLSLMEKKIIELIMQQKTSRQIADAFFVSEKLIEKHRSNIIEKLGLPKEKNVLLIWAIQHYPKK